MNKLKYPVIAVCLLAALCACATSHSVTLTWVGDVPNVASVTIYKSTGPCSPSAVFAALVDSQPKDGVYVDHAAKAGVTYCYYVVQVTAGKEGAPSNQFQTTI